MVLGVSLTSCGAYYLEGDGYGYVETGVFYDFFQYPFHHDRLTFTIRWNELEYENHDLSIRLVTPLNGLVSDGGPEIDGCYFLGRYNESLYEKVAVVECIDSPFGFYDLKIENIGFVLYNPIVDIKLERRTGNFIEEEFVTDFTSVFPGELLIVPYVL